MDILVSINCMTYNHENFIANAIKSFLMQKTNFDFEILIGEDCSTDGTKKIVEKFVSENPGKIRLITSEKNVGFRKNSKRLRSNSKGKFIALCEGDDYWIDDRKLQKQIDYMRKYPECSMCVHAAEVIDVRENKTVGFIRPFTKNKILSRDKFYMGGGHYFPTASIMYKKNLLNNMPDWFYNAPVEDHPLAWMLLYQGDIIYINEIMAVRNIWVPGSWNTTHQSVDEQKKIIHLQRMVSTLENFNEFSIYKYNKEINKILFTWKSILIQKQDNSNPLLINECKTHFSQLSIYDRLKFYINRSAPNNLAGIKKIKKSYRRLILKEGEAFVPSE